MINTADDDVVASAIRIAEEEAKEDDAEPPTEDGETPPPDDATPPQDGPTDE